MTSKTELTPLHLLRLITWSARLSDLWEPAKVAEFMLSPQAVFNGMKPVDMMRSDHNFEQFDQHMRIVLDGVYR